MVKKSMDQQIEIFVAQLHDIFKDYRLNSTEHLNERDKTSAGLKVAYKVSPLAEGAIPFEILISEQEVSITPGLTQVEFQLPTKEEKISEVFEQSLQLVKDILSQGCLEEVWRRNGKVVASKVQFNGSDRKVYQNRSLSGLIRIGATKEIKTYTAYKSRNSQ